uniref:Uncharacterized protein n=1 Tax=Macaca fascicularis TaxID=9541 RepID=A0A7N9CI47_MACFA
VAEITGTLHHALLLFAFLVETGFHHAGQAGLELPTSGDPAASASQSAGITGVSHCARTPQFVFILGQLEELNFDPDPLYTPMVKLSPFYLTCNISVL